jgi:choline kinase
MHAEALLRSENRDMERAIILDAGEGKRLRPLTKNLPKCLIKIGSKTILEHQLSRLVDCGIAEVILVVGYQSSMILRKLEQEPFDLKMKYVTNPVYHKTNTVYSLWLARGWMDKDFLYLNGDVFFHEEVLRRLIAAEHRTCLAVETRREVATEEVKVELTEEIVKSIGKEMDPSVADGEFVGIAKFSKETNIMFRRRLDEVVREGKLNAFFELAVHRMLDECSVYAIDVSDLPCIEIDTHIDLEEARSVFLEMGGELR